MPMLSTGVKIIFRRELRNYFNTPIGYVFGVTCLFFNFLFFFFGLLGIIPNFWEAGEASIRGYMNLLPVSFILMIPAISMRIWAEERKQGTIEMLATLPLRDAELVFGKFLAAWLFVCGLIVAALPLAISVWLIGPLDWGTTIAMVFGSALMAGAYTATGMVISSLTREQIVAFIVTFFVSLLMFISNYYIVTQHLPGSVASIVGFFSHSYHFGSFSRGVIDLGDVIYYVSFIAVMLGLNVYILRRER